MFRLIVCPFSGAYQLIDLFNLANSPTKQCAHYVETFGISLSSLYPLDANLSSFSSHISFGFYRLLNFYGAVFALPVSIDHEGLILCPHVLI